LISLTGIDHRFPRLYGGSDLSTTHASILSVAPILPTSDMERMQGHYEALGFTVKIHHGGYGSAARDGFNLHFRKLPQVTEPGALYFGVSDVDALHAEWVASGVGQTGDVFNPGFGVREAAHTDPDGNIIRFGSKPPEPPRP